MNISQINYYGTWTLIKKEVWRFIKVYHQTILSPVINVLLLLAIFSVAVGSRFDSVKGVNFGQFMSAGLIMMAAMQNSFANSSSSFVMSKVLGYIVDILMPPLSAAELLFAITIGAALRGILVGIVTFLAVLIFVPISFFDFGHAALSLVLATLFLALLGVLCGIVSTTFDHMSAITSYIITPLTFLSGTFYSVSDLPAFWHKVALLNPFFYMIDGFRYGLTGHNDGNLTTGVIFMIVVNIILAIALYLMLKKGYRIKN